MRAMQYQGYGGPAQIKLAEVPAPRPTATQLLVRVAASSVNPIDWKLHSGSYRWLMPMRFPSTPGFDLAGEVVEIGAQVTRFKVGEHVFAMADSRPGASSAEYAVVGEAAAARMPANLTATETAAIPLAGLTALQALRVLGQGRVGLRVLIVGASGGVGHYAVQIAKAQGAHVTGVCSSSHARMVRELGADRVIDYTQNPDLPVDEPYDLILDLVVRKPLHGLLAMLRKNGVYVASLPSFTRLVAAFFLPFVSQRRVKIIGVKSRGQDLDALRQLCEAGKLRTMIDKEFRLEELAAAHAHSQQGRTAGKIVIAIGEGP